MSNLSLESEFTFPMFWFKSFKALCISMIFLVFKSSNSDFHLRDSSAYLPISILRSPVCVSMYFSNAEITLSNLPISFSRVSLTVVACLRVACSRSSIFWRWSFNSSSMVPCLPKTASFICSTPVNRLFIWSPSTVCWCVRDIRFCSLVPLMISFIVESPS